MVLSVGDVLRTGLRSRATLRLANNSLLRLSELTTIEIQPSSTNTLEKPSLKLNNGKIDLLRKPGVTNSTPVITPNTKGEIRG